MKKTVFMAILMMLSLGFSTVIASEPDKPKSDVVPNKTENKMSEEEISRLTRRVEEIRDMDKSELTAKEKKELRKELREIRENVKRDGGYIYIGAGTLLVVILLVILLL